MADEFGDGFNPQEALSEIESDASDYDADLEVWDGLPEGIQFYQTATTAYKTGRDPRTLRAAYDHSTNTMYVVFYSGVYYMYSDVPPSVWESFKASPSPGNFLWNEGFDARGPQGIVYAYQPVDMGKISKKRRISLTANLEQAKLRQAGLKGRKTVKRLYAKGQRYSNPNNGGF